MRPAARPAPTIVGEPCRRGLRRGNWNVFQFLAYPEYDRGGRLPPWPGATTRDATEGSGRTVTKQVQQLDRVIIRFAGDSGDGMQLTGDRFTQETASFGNDLSTLPNFPAEIRAPAGTLPGRLVVPGALRRPRHPDPGRRARRAGRDEPGRAARPTSATCRGRRRSSSTPTSSPPAT